MKKKFYEFKNITTSNADLYIYGEIVQEKSVDWWTGEESITDVDLMGFKEELDNLSNVKTLNMYINSPGGDVFTASTMISMLERLKSTGTIINAYVDGLSASAASFLMMVADNINLYKNSVVMVHKPMSIAIGNANDMRKTIDALDKIEESVMMPMYMTKAKATSEEITSLIDAETWLNAADMNKYFNVNLLDQEKVAVANIESNLFKSYKNIPDFIKNSIKTEEKEVKKEHFEEKNAFFVEEKQVEDISTKEQEIKTKLDLIRNSLKIKQMKEGEMKYE